MGADQWVFVWVARPYVCLSNCVWTRSLAWPCFLCSALLRTETHVVVICKPRYYRVGIHLFVCLYTLLFIRSIMRPAISQDQAIVVSKLAEMMHKMTITRHGNPMLARHQPRPCLTSKVLPCSNGAFRLNWKSCLTVHVGWFPHLCLPLSPLMCTMYLCMSLLMYTTYLCMLCCVSYTSTRWN